MWVPRYSERTLGVAPWLVLTLAGVGVLVVVALYYLRSSAVGSVGTVPSPASTASPTAEALGPTAVARTATDFAVVLLAAGFAIVLVGVVLVLGEVVKAVELPSEATAGRPGERSLTAAQALPVAEKVISGLVGAAKGLTPGRLLIVVGVVPMLLSAWVAQSATSVTLTETEPEPVVTESPSVPADDSETGAPGEEPAETPNGDDVSPTAEPGGT